MNERTVFITALEKEDEGQRKEYLDETCAGDPALRKRVEALLRSHERDGKFLDVSAAEQIAPGEVTREEVPAADDGGQGLEFLTPSDKPGSLGRLGHYEIQEVIGKGGMGIVLKAFDETLHRVVAIKVMAAQLATGATARQRFAREAQAAAAVSHDHIVTIHAVEEAAPLPYLVMQYVAGLSLQQRLDRDGPLDLTEILRIGMQTASGLAAAHAQGLVHRDIKPANILLENGVERVKITDFGLARAAAEASLTQTGVVAGTPQYMSPEQAEGKAIDQRTDLFSLGSVLYAMCTGRAPFRASGSMAVLKRVCEEKPSPIRESRPETPEWLVEIIDRLHPKDPAERFQSATEVAGLLGQYLAHLQRPAQVPMPDRIAPVRQPRDRRRNSRRGWAVAAAVLLLLLTGLGMTEATGLTNLAGTVIRVFTTEGTLVVKVDDPEVKVTIEGDGGLVITGAGPQEIRLRPGSYRFRAIKDGKSLQEELVTISRGDRRVVTVALEPAAAAETPMVYKVRTHQAGIIAFFGTAIKPGERVPSDRLVTVKTPEGVERIRLLRQGDQVETGQLLARLDDQFARSEVTIRKAKLTASEAELTVAEKTREEAKRRYDTQIKRRKMSPAAASEEEVRSAELTWERYVAEVKSKQQFVLVAASELEQARLLLERCEIRSPIRGVIRAMYKRPGESVKSAEAVLAIEPSTP
jgi:multidrug efflux pump subunit AcrA (membrane-fusion protein)